MANDTSEDDLKQKVNCDYQKFVRTMLQQITIWTYCNLFVRTPFLKKFIRTYEAAEEFFMSAECLLTGAEQLH